MLLQFLAAVPSGVGEIGLDRWVEDYDWEAQQEMFRVQMEMAAERNLPVTIHCLQAWGKLLELLQKGPRPREGFCCIHMVGRERWSTALRAGSVFFIAGLLRAWPQA
jgi:TatD DNase family protein